jgi:hypothetical protein
MPDKAISNTRTQQLSAVATQLPTCLLVRLVLVPLQQHEALTHHRSVGLNGISAELRLHGLALVDKVSRIARQPA